jgi:crotonobetainyl-CoA:carnitine CoA-transferase CaiB-like acyl-CoA transferase
VALPPDLATLISGYGESGPYRDMKAYDLLVQCETGLAAVTGSPEEPGRVGVSIADMENHWRGVTGKYYFPGMYTAILPMIPGIYSIRWLFRNRNATG